MSFEKDNRLGNIDTLRRIWQSLPLIFVGWLLLSVQSACVKKDTFIIKPHPTYTAISTPSKPEPLLQSGHSSGLRSVTFSPSGRLIASVGAEGSLIIWEAKTGRMLYTLGGGPSGSETEVTDVAFSPDGKWLALRDGSASVKLLEIETGREIGTLKSHPYYYFSISFSPDSRWLAIGSDDGVKLWDVLDSRELHTLNRGVRLENVIFSPDGRWLAGGVFLGGYSIWEVGSWRMLPYRTYGYPHFSSDGRRILDATYMSLIMRELETGRDLYTIDEGFSMALMVERACALSPDNQLLAIAASNGTVKLYEASNGRELLTFKGHSKNVTYVAFSPDGKKIASGSEDKTVKLWEVASGRELRTFHAVTDVDCVDLVAFSPDGKSLVGMGRGFLKNECKVWNLETGQELQFLKGYVDGVLSVALSPDGTLLANGTGLGNVKLWDVVSGRLSLTIKGHDGEVRSVAFSPNGQLLASGSKDKTVKLWEVRSGRLLRTLSGHTGGVTSVAFSPNGQWLASGSSDKTVKLWEVESGQESYTIKGVWSVDSVAFSPDGRLLAFTELGAVKLCDISGKRVLHTLRVDSEFTSVTSVAFSPDGRWLANGCGGLLEKHKKIILWDVSNLRKQRVLMNAGWISSLAFSPDSKWLASGTAECTVKLWDVAGGRELKTFYGHSSRVSSVVFSVDGRLIVTGSWDGSVRVFDPGKGEALSILLAMRHTHDWLVVNPSGLFDGSEEGMQKLLAWRIGHHTYPPDRFFSDYYTPGVLSRIFAGERPRPLVDIAHQKLPPNIEITNVTRREGRATVTAMATDQGGGVEEVRLYHNGKRVDTHEGSRGRQSTYRFQVNLVAGENNFTVKALSEDGVESNEDVARVVQSVSVTKPVLHLLVVGINEYEDPSFDLGFARQDADAVLQFFDKHGSPLFNSIKAIRLVDKNATKENFFDALEQLVQKAQREDVVIVYLAGHGVGLGQQFYFLTHKMRKQLDEEAAIREHGITASAIGSAFRRMKALKQVLILDTCQSEAALPILAKAVIFRGRRAAEDKALKTLARSEGVYLIAASTQQQRAYEVKELGHGILTYALLRGLGEKPPPQALSPGERMVTMKSLVAYVDQQVPELTEKYHEGKKQYPVSHEVGMDFPLAVP
jgi:WD40 repeat protein